MTGELLNLEQVASICGVTNSRVRRWIAKKGLEVVQEDRSQEKIEKDRLIDFLLHHNMPLPESILPFKAKKILFVFANEKFNDLFVQFLFRFLEHIRKEANCVTDYIAYGPSVKMKIMVFRPHLVLLDTADCESEALKTAQFIKKTEEFSTIKVVSLVEKPSTVINNKDNQYALVDSEVPRSMDIQLLIKKIETHF